MKRRKKEITRENAVSTVETFTLRGYEQKVLIEGKRADLPIVIALHGGPGTPIPFCVGCRGLFPDITDNHILVCWDQYGCGINNAELSDSFTIDNFVDMTVDLVKALKEKFPKNKLFLFGMSWGSILSAKAAEEVPEYIDGVLTYGQVLQAPMLTQETLHTILESKAPAKVKNECKTIFSKEHFDKRDCMKISRYVRQYTEGYTNKNEPKSPIFGMVKAIMTSPDYRFKDFIAMFKNGYLKNQSLINELSEVDLRETMANIEVPYHIIQGDTDIVTATGMIKEFIKSCNNPNLSCEVVENAAHMPGMNGMTVVIKSLQRMVQ